MNNLSLIKNLIYEIRGFKVMLDSDLAELYGVETKALNRAVKRNIQRFPSNFMFQLTKNEWQTLRCQIGTSKDDNEKRGGRQYLPYVFTEQGVAMLSSVLHSEQAIQINIQIMNTFVKIRQFALENKELTKQLNELENYFIEHCKRNDKDKQIVIKNMLEIQEAINLLMDRTKPTKIGFK